MKAILCLWIALIAVNGEQLPDYMVGDFKMTTSEGFSDFMYAMDVGWFKRSIACTLYPLQQIRQTGDDISLNTFTTFQSTYTDFKLGTPFTEETADGRTTTTVASVEGNKLVKIQTPDASTGHPTTKEVREFVDKGDTMNLILTIEGQPKIKSVRVYKRQPTDEDTTVEPEVEESDESTESDEDDD